jgi:chemotaxis-related protein WspB
MLFLTFQIGADRYALDARQIVEVLPLVSLKQLPGAPRGVAGLFDCRGRLVPVVDLSDLATRQPARRCLSTRIVLVRHGDGDRARTVGLIAERATATMTRDASDFADAEVAGDAAYLGPVARDGRGLVQWVDAAKLLPDFIHDALVRRAAAAS